MHAAKQQFMNKGQASNLDFARPNILIYKLRFLKTTEGVVIKD